MNRLVSNDLWPELARLARKARAKRAAIAYVTNDDVIQFGQGDTLITDASYGAIASGQTDAELLRSARMRGADLYSCPGLHAKVMIMSGYGYIGSANLSRSSMDDLIEVGLITDSPIIVSMIGDFISKLKEQSDRIDDYFMESILSLKVEKRFNGIGSRKKKRSVHQSGRASYLDCNPIASQRRFNPRRIRNDRKWRSRG